MFFSLAAFVELRCFSFKPKLFRIFYGGYLNNDLYFKVSLLSQFCEEFWHWSFCWKTCLLIKTIRSPTIFSEIDFLIKFNLLTKFKLHNIKLTIFKLIPVSRVIRFIPVFHLILELYCFTSIQKLLHIWANLGFELLAVEFNGCQLLQPTQLQIH